MANSPTRLAHRLLYGAIAGTLGAACMTVIRMTARRHGVIEKTIPQAAEEWLAARLPAIRPESASLHHLADTLMHLGYGAFLGSLYGVTVRRRTNTALLRGFGYGIATLIAGSWIALPLIGAKGAAWRKRPPENLVDLVAHLAFGAATALVAEELTAQPDRGVTSDASRRAARIG